MDFRLTEEQEMTQDGPGLRRERSGARGQDNAKTDPQACVPWDLLEKASALGLRTTAIPEAFGGEGADYLTPAIILEELGVADQGCATIIRGCDRSRRGSSAN